MRESEPPWGSRLLGKSRRSFEYVVNFNGYCFRCKQHVIV